WSEVELERRYGLKLFRADKPLSQHGEMVGNVSDAIHAEGAAAWVKAHSSKVRSGMARKKAEGKHIGRPRKDLTAAERALVAKLRAEGMGWRSIALAVSRERGAFDVADPAARRGRCVSHMTVRRAIEARRGVTKPAA